MTIRYYVASLTDMGCATEEFESEEARAQFLRGCDDTEDDYYVIDVGPNGCLNFELATCGEDE